MNGPLIFTIIQLINALECIEEENTPIVATNTTTNTNGGVAAANNETHIERQILAKQDPDSDDEEAVLTNTESTGPASSGPSNTPEELSNVFDKLLKNKHCPCPCSGVKHIPVCGKTTNGAMKDFDSQCHLICHNQCTSADRYAVKFYGRCPLVPVIPPPVLNRKNIYSNPFVNRRADGTTGITATGGIYQSFITPLVDWEQQSCDCSYCPQTRFTRLDYYPICAERSGQKVTFDSWCHFDCENKCVRNTGYQYLYMHKGSCRRFPVQIEREGDFGTRRVHPPIFSPVTAEPCTACNTRCKEYFEPVCAKNSKNEYLSFKSRCHMRCHNLCQYENANDNFVHILDGQCPWLSEQTSAPFTMTK